MRALGLPCIDAWTGQCVATELSRITWGFAITAFNPQETTMKSISRAVPAIIQVAWPLAHISPFTISNHDVAAIAAGVH